jgi:hypothetical protein
LLAAIEIDGRYALAGFHQGDRDMQGGGGLPRTALLIAQHNDVCGARLPLTRLHQHDLDPCEYLQLRASAVKRNAHARIGNIRGVLS